MANGLLPRDLVVSSFQLQKNGLTPVGKPTFDEWVSCGQFIKDAEQSVQFFRSHGHTVITLPLERLQKKTQSPKIPAQTLRLAL